MSSSVSNFKREPGISLEMLQHKGASSHAGTTWFSSSCFGILELLRGTQGASRVAARNYNLHSSCQGEHGIAPDSLQGNPASRRVDGGLSRSFSSCGRKPWVFSTCDGDLRELLVVLIGIQEYCGLGRVLSDSTVFGAMKERLISS